MTNKKFWALLIAVVMMISVFSLCALAADDEPVTLTSAGDSEGETMTTTSTEEPTDNSEETDTTEPTETKPATETGTESEPVVTTGSEEENEDGETAVEENKSWFAKHLNFVIAVAVVIFLVALYFIIRLCSKKFREKTDKFWKDYNAEFKKLVWPTKQQLWKNTAVVLVTLVAFAAVLALIDFGLGKGVYALKDLFDFIRPAS